MALDKRGSHINIFTNFSMKTYIVGTHGKHLGTQNIRFHREIR